MPEQSSSPEKEQPSDAIYFQRHRRKSLNDFASTLEMVQAAADKLLEESEALQDELGRGVAGMSARVDSIDIRMGSIGSEVGSGDEMPPSPTADLADLGTRRSSMENVFERKLKHQEFHDKIGKEQNADLHTITSPNGDVRQRRVESVTIIKGGRQKEASKIMWSDSDVWMCWGRLPTNLFGWKKQALEITTLLFVLVSVILIVVQSFPEYDPHCFKEVVNETTGRVAFNCLISNGNQNAKGYWQIFYTQTALVGWFTIEYIIRFMAVRPHWRVQRPYTMGDFWWAKFKHVFSFMTIIDFLAISPFYIERLMETSGKPIGGAGTILTVLRVFRILRVFKLTKNNQTLTDLLAAFRIIADDIMLIAVVLSTMMMLLSTAIFYAERDATHEMKYEGQDIYDTITGTFYWCSITLTSVGYGDVTPATRLGRIIAVIAALLSMLVINLPIAIIIISFDEVYRIRRGRELRATLVTQRLFKWVDRAKMATERAKHPRKHDVLFKRKEDEKKRMNGEWVDGADKGPKKPAVKLRLAGAPMDAETLQREITRRAKRLEHQKIKRRRKQAMVTMKKMILDPEMSTKVMRTTEYTGQENYLASKYFTRWEKTVMKGRKEREEKAAAAIRALVNLTDGVLHEHQKAATLRWLNRSRAKIAERKNRKKTLRDLRMKSTDKRGQTSAFGNIKGLGGSKSYGGRPTIGLAFGKVEIELEDTRFDDSEPEDDDW